MLAALVAWRNRWATGLRLLAPLVFLAMALMVQEVMNMNAEMTGRIRDMPATYPEQITSIPACSTELFIHTKPCLDFIFTPKDDARVQVSSCAGASVAKRCSYGSKPALQGCRNGIVNVDYHSAEGPLRSCNMCSCSARLNVMLLPFCVSNCRRSWQQSDSTTAHPYLQKG